MSMMEAIHKLILDKIKSTNTSKFKIEKGCDAFDSHQQVLEMIKHARYCPDETRENFFFYPDYILINEFNQICVVDGLVQITDDEFFKLADALPLNYD